METILLIVIAVVAVVLINAARRFGQKNLWGKLADKMNDKTAKDLQAFIKEEEKKKQKNV